MMGMSSNLILFGIPGVYGENSVPFSAFSPSGTIGMNHLNPHEV